jgi:hypothetical protein
MSDYLGNLAARTLAAPPLRPRVRMRFEPEAVAEVAAAPPQIEPPVHEQRAAETPRAEQPPRVIEYERVREVAKPGRETTGVVTIEGTAKAPPQTAPREPEVIEHVERIEMIKSPVESGPLVRSVPTSGRNVRSPQVNNEAPRPHRYDEEPPRVVAKRPPMRERERLAERRVRLEPEPQARPETAVAAEPSVQVSIGRIEIRATTAPPAQRRARGRTAMSIDDYVAKRDAKERR